VFSRLPVPPGPAVQEGQERPGSRIFQNLVVEQCAVAANAFVGIAGGIQGGILETIGAVRVFPEETGENRGPVPQGDTKRKSTEFHPTVPDGDFNAPLLRDVKMHDYRLAVSDVPYQRSLAPAGNDHRGVVTEPAEVPRRIAEGASPAVVGYRPENRGIGQDQRDGAEATQYQRMEVRSRMGSENDNGSASHRLFDRTVARDLQFPL